MTITDHDAATAVQRLEALADPGTVRPLNPIPGPVAMRAAEIEVDGRPVVAYAHDPHLAGGSVAGGEAMVILEAMRRARRADCPVIGAVSSPGARIQSGVDGLDAYGSVFAANVALRTRVPQISIILGACAGGGCYSPALTDFVVVSESSRMFLTGPTVVRDTIGEQVDAEALGGPEVHARNGVAHLVAADEDAALAFGRRLIAYLPGAGGGRLRAGSPGAEDPSAALPDDARKAYDMRGVIDGIADTGSTLELCARWAPNMLTVLAAIEGRPVGVLANQPRHLGGAIDVEASAKGAWFVSTCDRLGIPLLVLVDTPGFMPGTQQEAAGIIRIGAELVRAFAAATVPRVTVVVRKAYGGGYIAMNSRGLGADAWLVWPTAQVGVVGAHQAVGVLHRRELASAVDPDDVRTRLAERYAAAQRDPASFLDDEGVHRAVRPEETRGAVVAAIDAAAAAGASRRLPAFRARRTAV